jgi:rhodanese-related sulfurtransferase
MNQITPAELRQKIDSSAAFHLIDVRELSEHDEFNLGGMLIPLGEIMNRVDDIPNNVPVIVYCKMGIRSQIAIQRLEEKFGFTNLFNLQGGVERWKRELPG